MKRFFFVVAATCLTAISFGQRLTQITLTGSPGSDIISYMTDDNVIINLSLDGKVIEWGIEYATGRYNSYPGKLDKYMGRTDFYGEADNVDFRGKVKYLGRTAFTYYSSYENEQLKGKLKSIGSTIIDYYSNYEDEALRGKIRNAGVTTFTYYSSFDNEAFRGRFKTIGGSSFTYYTSFDDKAYKGKIKSIGSQNFSYYSSYDKQEYRGAIKGFQTQYVINGIKYLLRN